MVEKASKPLTAAQSPASRKALAPDRQLAATPADHSISLMGELDQHLFNEGTHGRLYDCLGAHPLTAPDGREGTHFGVWAPDAEGVSVVGNFNGWNPDLHPLAARDQSGVWEGFIPGIKTNDLYKYHIRSRHNGYRVNKADPVAFRSEVPPRTASVVWKNDYQWGDRDWMEGRWKANALDAPVSIYEVHLGSWRRVPEEDGRVLTYRELAPLLADYVRKTGFTHVELMPCTEHPFYGSWGYQTTGYFAPTSRYGSPEDFMYLIDLLHQNGVGVILDWVPSHFPSDEHGLGYFDGTHTYEHADPRQGYHPDWDSLIFNYGRNEVRSFLMSSAAYWLDRFHIDGLRVDAVASMLYLDYSRHDGNWIPNQYKGRENLDAIGFLRQLNTYVGREFPDTLMIAEESTAWPMVSRPVDLGGLGFHLKWDMGWMHDTLKYFAFDPIHRKYHHNQITFRMLYYAHENFVLPLSHDEVVHGKGSLYGKMPGDEWQKFANLRLLYGYMWGQAGKKLLFMGGELAQWPEWKHDDSLEWHALDGDLHAGVQRWIGDLNRVYREQPALYELDCEPDGFSWIDCSDWENSIVSFLRRGKSSGEVAIVVCNFTPVPRDNYRIGVPRAGRWRVLLNSDAKVYGGSGVGPGDEVEAEPIAMHGHDQSVRLVLPPLGAMVLVP